MYLTTRVRIFPQRTGGHWVCEDLKGWDPWIHDTKGVNGVTFPVFYVRVANTFFTTGLLAGPLNDPKG